MDKIWVKIRLKSYVIGRCGGMENQNGHAELKKVER